MRFLTGLVSSALILILTVSVAGAAAPQAVKMEAEAGFDGYYKIGEWIPIAVTLSNDGQDLEGKVWLEAQDESGDRPVYAKSLSLPSRSKKRVYLYIYTTGFMRDVEINFQVGNDVVASTKAALRPLQPNEYLFGVVSGDPSTGNFLSSVKLPSFPSQGEGKATVSHMSLSQIPPKAQALKSLDYLVFSDVSTAELETEERQAVENWVSSGGVLVVAGGAGGQKTAAGLKGFLPIKLAGSRSLDTVSGLEELVGSRIKAEGPFLASVASEVSGANILAQQDGMPLVIQRELGLGRVVFLALDISVPPLNGLLEDGLFWKRILAGQGSSSVSNGLNKRTGMVSNMQAALSNIPAMDLPSVTYLAVFLVVYILCIGPLNYLVLRRFDRREWAWVTIPALTIAFTGGAYAIGFGTKGGDVIVHEITVLRSSYGSPMAEAESYIGIFSPARRTYQLQVAGDVLLSKPMFFGPSGFASAVEVFQGDPAQVKDMNVNAWSMQPMMAEGYVNLGGPGVRAELWIDGDRTKGKVTNATGATIEDAVLLNGSNVAKVGTLQAGETKEVDLAFDNADVAWRPSVGSLIIGQTQPPMGGEDRDQMRKRMIADAAFGYYGKQPTNWSTYGLGLVGWQRESPLDVDVKGQGINRQSTVLLIASLPVAFGDRSVTVPAGYASKSIVGMTGNKIGASPFGFGLSEGSITVRHQLPSEAAGMTVKDLSLHYGQPGVGPMPRAPAPAGSSQPSLQLFDWKQGKWVDQGKVSAGVTPISNPAAFVSESGAIEVKLEAASGGYVEISQFDFAVKGER